MSSYVAEAASARADIAAAGAPVTFTTASGRVYDPDTGLWSGGTPVTTTGSAIQVKDDPMRFSALGLQIADPITLLVAAAGLTLVPSPNIAMTWRGVIYTVKNVEALAPNGSPITYTVIGSRE